MALSELAVRKVKPKERAYKVRDSDELYLLVKENGSKLWRVNYRYLGRYRTVALARMNSKLLRPSMSVVPCAMRRSRSTERTSEPSCARWLERWAASLASSWRSIWSMRRWNTQIGRELASWAEVRLAEEVDLAAAIWSAVDREQTGRALSLRTNKQS